MRDDVGSRRLLAAGTVLLALAGLPAAASAQDACSNAALGGVGPDCRALEQVTPADKNSRAVSEGQPLSAAVGGGRVAFRSFGAFAGNESAPYYSSLQARRGDDAWTVRGIDPLLVNVGLSVSPATLAISDDGTKSLVASPAVLTSGAPQEGTKLYLRDLDDPTRYTLIGSSTNGLTDSSVFADGASDFSTLSIQSNSPLEPDEFEAFGPVRLYRWSAADGLELVGITNTFDVDDPADPNDFATWTNPPSYDETRRTLSEGGQRVTYERQTGDSPETLDTEVRQYSDGANRLVSHPDGQRDTPANGTSPIASPDGRTVTFVSTDPLTDDSVPDSQSIYQETEDGTVVDLLAGLDGRDAPLAGLRLQTVSPDGRYVWFTSTAAVVFGLNPQGGLYAFDTTGETPLKVIALASGVNPTVRFSPNGLVAAYTTPGDVNGQPSLQACTEGRECPNQVFTANLSSGGIGDRCITCSGTPAGAVRLDAAAAPQRSDAVFDDGRVFFEARARLTSADDNAELDVYQYTPDQGTNDSTTTLLSGGGAGNLPALFGGVSRDGQDVYVITQRQLVPSDDDDRSDVYSARAGGGIAAQQVRPTTAEPCRGDACKPPATPVPATPAPVNEGSNEPAPPAPPTPPAFSVSTPSKSALRTAARSGTVSVRVRVGAAGTISAGLRGKVRGSTRTLGSRTVRVDEADTVTLRLRLSRAARSKLRRTGSLSARLTVAYSERTNRVRKTIRFEGGRR